MSHSVDLSYSGPLYSDDEVTRLRAELELANSRIREQRQYYEELVTELNAENKKIKTQHQCICGAVNHTAIAVVEHYAQYPDHNTSYTDLCSKIATLTKRIETKDNLISSCKDLLGMRS